MYVCVFTCLRACVRACVFALVFVHLYTVHVNEFYIARIRTVLLNTKCFGCKETVIVPSIEGNIVYHNMPCSPKSYSTPS